MDTWKDYVRGEWWIDSEGHAEFADSNVGDMGHEGIAERSILSSYADELWEALKEYNKDNPEDAVKLVDHKYDEGDEIHQQYHDGGIPNEVGEKVMGKEKWDLFKKDVRTCYMKYDHMAMAINLDFAVWKLTDKHLKAIQSLIGDEAQGEVKDKETEMSIEEVATKKHLSMPVAYFMTLDRINQFWGYHRKKEASILLAALETLEKAVLSRLKYNIFSSDHPKASLRGKLFKFVGNGKVQFLQSKKTVSVSSSDLHSGGKKLYYPADMA